MTKDQAIEYFRIHDELAALVKQVPCNPSKVLTDEEAESLWPVFKRQHELRERKKKILLVNGVGWSSSREDYEALRAFGARCRAIATS